MNFEKGKIVSEYDLDDPRRTLQHRDIILSKPSLKRIYEGWYDELMRNSANCPEGKKIEIGAGGGFFKEMYPEIETSDILDLPVVDKVFSAEEMPYAEGELSAIFMINVFHHIPDVRKFLKEADRTLKKGGKIIMIEPGNSPFSRFIYKRFHHEMFDEKRDWFFPQTGPLSGSNQALPYIVFKRDRKIFEEEFPAFKVESVNLHTGLRYLVSGGLSRSPMLPGFMFGVLKFAESLAPGLIGMFQTVVVKKV